MEKEAVKRVSIILPYEIYRDVTTHTGVGTEKNASCRSVH